MLTVRMVDYNELTQPCIAQVLKSSQNMHTDDKLDLGRTKPLTVSLGLSVHHAYGRCGLAQTLNILCIQPRSFR